MSLSCPAGAQSQSFSQPEVQADPFRLMRHLLSLEQPITRDPAGGFYIAARWNDIAYIYAHPEIFSNRIEFIFYRPDSPLWPEMERRYRGARLFADADARDGRPTTAHPPSRAR